MVNSIPFYRSLWAMASVCLVGVLFTDLAYLVSADFIWVDMSDWLVTFGVVVGFVALVVGFVETFAARRMRRTSRRP